MLNHIAIIDPLISPDYLTSRLKAKGIQITAVFSVTKNLSEKEKKLRVKEALFDDSLYVDQDNEAAVLQTASYLKEKKVEAVFYGSEYSVAFTDKVAQLVCPDYANDIETSFLRCDKYEMQNALKQAALPSVEQMKVENHILTPDQKKMLGNWDFPVFVKPVNGAATVGGQECLSLQEIEAVLQQNVLLPNGKEIQNYVIQEFLVGEEYFVDCFSLSGSHYVVTVKKYQKIVYNNIPTYRFMEEVDPKAGNWRICVDYIKKVLDIVGLKNGFSHSELFLTDKGPRLVEVNPRISGIFGLINYMGEHTLQYSQTEAFWRAANLESTREPAKLFKQGRIAFVQNWVPRKIGSLSEDLLKSLPSYHSHLFLAKEGDFLGEPKSLADTVLFVTLITDNKEQLAMDYSQLEAWEKASQLF